MRQRRERKQPIAIGPRLPGKPAEQRRDAAPFVFDVGKADDDHAVKLQLELAVGKREVAEFGVQGEAASLGGRAGGEKPASEVPFS
jgi:hypothetical protein